MRSASPGRAPARPTLSGGGQTIVAGPWARVDTSIVNAVRRVTTSDPLGIAPVRDPRQQRQRERPAADHGPAGGRPARTAERDVARLHEPVRRQELRDLVKQAVLA